MPSVPRSTTGRVPETIISFMPSLFMSAISAGLCIPMPPGVTCHIMFPVAPSRAVTVPSVPPSLVPPVTIISSLPSLFMSAASGPM